MERDKNRTEPLPAVLCVAEGSEGEWEAICLDLDLAVQGKSFDEVYQKLNDQVYLYLDGVMALPKADRQRLLSRRAPLSVRLPFIWRILGSVIGRKNGRAHHEYTIPIGRPLVTA